MKTKRKRRNERKKCLKSLRAEEACVRTYTKDSPIKSDLRKMYGKRYTDGTGNMEMCLEEAKLSNRGER